MAYIYDLTDTWNAGGTTFNAIKMNVTDSASAVTSKLVSLQTNGTEHFSVTKAGVGYVSGNLGIGTSSPSSKLDVVGVDGNSVSKIKAATALMRFRPYVDATIGSAIEATNIAESAYSPLTLTGSVVRVTTNTGALTVFDASGNVGIGTSSPAYPLQVRRAGGAGSLGISIDSVGTTDRAVQYFAIQDNAAGSGSGHAFYYRAPSSTTDTLGLMLDEGGNVGIGTSSPSSKLTVASSNVTVNAGYGIAFTGDQTRIMTPEDNVYGALINWGAAGGCRFIAGTSERMRIDGTGNLLVGKSSTGSEVTTDGAVFYKNASGGGMTTYLTNGGVGTVLAVSTQGDTQAIIFFRSGSNVGNISVTTTATAYNTSSDYRLKDIDGPVANSGAYIDALKPVQGSWKADGSRFIGLLAHEAQEVSETPIATGEKDGEEMQAMDYSAPEIIANLIAELQSVRARLAQLEGN